MSNMVQPITLEHTEWVLRNTHSPSFCYSKSRCTIHNRSNHHMRNLPQEWNGDENIMERLCIHGVGHTDPDEIPGFEIHNCDGCCVPVQFSSPDRNVSEFGGEELFDASWCAEGLSLLETILKSYPAIEYSETGSFENHLFWFKPPILQSANSHPNFVFKNLNIKIYWDKMLGRGVKSNIKPLYPIDWYIVINACIQSLRG